MSVDTGCSPTKRGRTDHAEPIEKKFTPTLTPDTSMPRSRVAATRESGASKKSATSLTAIKKQRIEVQSQKTTASTPLKNSQTITTPTTEINDATWRWFQRTVAMHVHVTGPMIQATALKFAIEFGYEDFRATNVWLQSFRSAHHIVNGRSDDPASAGATGADDQSDIMGSFFAELPELCASYLPEDVFNAVEVGLVYKALPCKRADHLLADVGDSQTDYLTVLLATSAAGEKLTPIVISREAPCFPENGGDILPVEWRRNLKAWMTSRSFVQWLNDLNVTMCGDDRNIILFLSSCLAHPNVELSNVRLCFFPPKQSSGVLPLHHGVSQAFKLAYRREFLTSLIGRSALTPDVGEVLRSVSVLDVAGWIDVAWKSLSEDSITRAFESAGFPIALPPDMAHDGTQDTRLRDLIRRAGETFSLPYMLLSETEFVNVDTWVPVYPTIDSVIPRRGPPPTSNGCAVAAVCSPVQRSVASVAIALDSAKRAAETPSSEDVRLMIQKLKRYALIKKPDILNDVLRLENSFSGKSTKSGDQNCCECNREKQIIVLD